MLRQWRKKGVSGAGREAGGFLRVHLVLFFFKTRITHKDMANAKQNCLKSPKTVKRVCSQCTGKAAQLPRVQPPAEASRLANLPGRKGFSWRAQLSLPGPI